MQLHNFQIFDNEPHYVAIGKKEKSNTGSDNIETTMLSLLKTFIFELFVR